MRISDWSSDVCSSDLKYAPGNTVANCMVKMNADKAKGGVVAAAREQLPMLKAFVVEKDLVSIPGKEEAEVRESPPYNRQNSAYIDIPGPYEKGLQSVFRSEEHTSELQSLMRTPYAFYRLKT